ncbi:MAG: L,D-transpeptidase family protein [Sphingobacteriales bacterium]|nr:L,D-transpeptidase family protein [Sphingobacteriales bacterium]
MPYSIAINEILPKLNEQPTYLKINDMDLLDANGNIVTLTDAQIKALTRETFRYDIRQRASEDNSLGRYVLYFPNKHFIYMHDTNAPYLFEKEKRALSHGCIRTQEIERICKYLIENNSDTSIETAKAAYDNKET